MGVYSYGYKAAKSPIGKKVVETVKNIFTKKGKVSPDIKSVPPFVPQTKKEKLKRDLRVATQKRKTSEVKLDNTIFRINQQKKRLEDKLGAGSSNPRRPGKQNLAKGGRAGFKRGTGLIPKRKSNVEKIKKTFGTLSVRAGIDNNPNPTYADKIAGAKMKNKKKKRFV